MSGYLSWRTSNVQSSSVQSSNMQSSNVQPQNSLNFSTHWTKSKNVKKILCTNITTHGYCNYGNKCMFAHTLEEQVVDPSKKIAYDILNSILDKTIGTPSNPLHDDMCNLSVEIYRSLLGLTRLCENCGLNICTGGYNCRFGACAKKYVVCLKDLNHGICEKYEDNKCEKIHVTKFGIGHYFLPFLKGHRLSITNDVDHHDKDCDEHCEEKNSLNSTDPTNSDEIFEYDFDSDSDKASEISFGDNEQIGDECDQSIFY